MDEGILEVSEVAGDRVVELRIVDELRVVGLITCEREKSSRMTKVPLAEPRRLFVTESKSSEYIERKDRKKVKSKEK